MSILEIRNKMKSRAIELKVVFKENDWEIRETRGEYAFAQVPSLIYHQCSQIHSTGRWDISPRIWMYRKELKNPCGICMQVPPPHIQAIFQMLNYDCLEEA